MSVNKVEAVISLSPDECKHFGEALLLISDYLKRVNGNAQWYPLVLDKISDSGFPVFVLDIERMIDDYHKNGPNKTTRMFADGYIDVDSVL